MLTDPIYRGTNESRDHRLSSALAIQLHKFYTYTIDKIPNFDISNTQL